MIIKKQPLGEADEIVTLFSRQQGKVRAVAKSSKLSTSKLQYALQPMFQIDVAITGVTNLPKLIRAAILESYPTIRSSPERVALWFVVAELIIKLAPDNQPNEELHDSVLAYLDFLNTSKDLDSSELELGLLKFKLVAMAATGLGIHDIARLEPGQNLLFSSSKGGFYYDSSDAGTKGGSADSSIVNSLVWQGFKDLQEAEFTSLPEPGTWHSELSKLVSNFISYQLEREIKSEKYL